MAKYSPTGDQRQRKRLGVEYADSRAPRHYDALFLHPVPYGSQRLEDRVGPGVIGSRRWSSGSGGRELHDTEADIETELDTEAREWAGL